MFKKNKVAGNGIIYGETSQYVQSSYFVPDTILSK